MNIEVWKLIVSALTPVVIAVLGYFFNKTLSNQLRDQKQHNAIVEKRMKIYSEIASPMNNIYCYINDVGNYKDLSPKEIIRNKRFCDQKFHTYRPIWSKDVIIAYKQFMKSSFLVFAASGQDAKIRTISTEKKNTNNWNATWEKLITNEREKDYHQKYVNFLNAISNDLLIKVS